MDIPPSVGHDGRGGTVGGGDLRLPPPEHSHTVYCDQDHYGPVSGGGAENGVVGLQAVVGAGRNVCGGDSDGVSGGRTDGGGEGDVWDGDGKRLSRWEDYLANLTLGTEPNAPLVYALVLEHHNQIMSMLGDPGGRLERNIEREKLKE